MINEPTCYNNPLNPSSIDVMLTNRLKRFHASQTIETGLLDHKSVLKLFSPKQKNNICKIQLGDELNAAEITYKKFERIFITLSEMHAPTKEKIVRVNNAPFMNKTLSKAVMTR